MTAHRPDQVLDEVKGSAGRPWRRWRAMRLLICGSGAEDARSPLWGHVVASLLRLGHVVETFDADAATRNDRDGDPLPALRWLLDETRPQLVLTVDPPSGVLTELRNRDVEVRPLTAEDVSSACHIELFVASESTVETEPVVDVVAVGT